MEQGETPSTPAAPEAAPTRTLSDFSRAYIATVDAEAAGAPPEDVQDDTPPPPPDQGAEAPIEAEQPEEPAPVEETPEPQESFAEVEIEGKLYKVPEEIKDGYLRQADYTRKTQEVAQGRRVVETLLTTAQQAVQAAQQFGDVLGQIKQADSAIEQFHKLDWQSLRDSDPVDYATKQADFTRWQMHRQQLAQGLTQAQQQVSHAQAQQLQARLQEAIPVLREKIPGWGEAKAKEIRSHASHYGFTDADLDGLYDPRQVMVLHDAMEYRKLMSKKVEASKKIANLPPVAKPSARPTQTDARLQYQKQRDQFIKGGGKDLDAMAGLLAQRLRGK